MYVNDRRRPGLKALTAQKRAAYEAAQKREQAAANAAALAKVAKAAEK